MSWHQMSIKSTKQGLEVYTQVCVDIVMIGTEWVWRQIDDDGRYTGPQSITFKTEAEAKSDALLTLGGIGWE